MRILLAGDTHGNTTHVRYLIDVAVDQGCDRIFQLGDFGAWEHMKQTLPKQTSAYPILLFVHTKTSPT